MASGGRFEGFFVYLVPWDGASNDSAWLLKRFYR